MAITTVSVSATGGGTGRVQLTGEGTGQFGRTVQLLATPEANSRFAYWRITRQDIIVDEPPPAPVSPEAPAPAPEPPPPPVDPCVVLNCPTNCTCYISDTGQAQCSCPPPAPAPAPAPAPIGLEICTDAGGLVETRANPVGGGIIECRLAQNPVMPGGCITQCIEIPPPPVAPAAPPAPAPAPAPEPPPAPVFTLAPFVIETQQCGGNTFGQCPPGSSCSGQTTVNTSQASGFFPQIQFNFTCVPDAPSPAPAPEPSPEPPTAPQAPSGGGGGGVNVGNTLFQGTDGNTRSAVDQQNQI